MDHAVQVRENITLKVSFTDHIGLQLAVDYSLSTLIWLTFFVLLKALGLPSEIEQLVHHFFVSTFLLPHISEELREHEGLLASLGAEELECG